MTGASGNQLIRRVSTGLPCGELFLAPMPGRYGPLEVMLDEMTGLGIDTVVSLAPLSEIVVKSPGYAELLDSGCLGFSLMSIPVEDFGVPTDRESFAADVERAASMLDMGRRLIVHCGAGIGRTGTFACCLLIALGATAAESAAKVRAAGSGPETPEQEALVGWFAGRSADGAIPPEIRR